ncbi:MAG TPA: isochorismatase family cysteine hydrolase [Nevskiaceae bacterium]|nr:isochorismatase family cysteine hydrolase [Nevskiaceae bacterium]
MPKTPGLRFGALGPEAWHLCIDLQRVFEPGAPWSTPWLERIRPVAHSLCALHPDRTVLTRFIPPARPEAATGSWRRFYEKWSILTGLQADPRWIELLPEFAALAPPAMVVDKPAYSPFCGTALHETLQARSVESVILTGTETDVCVLAAALDAVDRGYRTIVVRDAICSSRDSTHDALMRLYHERFREQIEVVDSEELLQDWR